MSIRFVLIIALTIFASGCATYTSNRYSVSVDNVMVLKTLNGTKLQVGVFTASEPGKTEIMCRGAGPIRPPDGQTFEAFIRKGLVDELRLAEVYSASSPIVLTGNLDAVDFSSVSGSWNLALTVSSSSGNSLSVFEDYSYTTTFVGEFACNLTVQAFVPAVQNLIGKVVRHAAFITLVE